VTSERPAPFEATASLRLMLQELGQVQPAERSAEDEQVREARMAARIDAEVMSLVVLRRARRRWVGVVAAAAVVLLTFGLRQARSTGGSLSISREPIAPSGVLQPPKVETKPALPAPPTPSATLPRVTSAPSGVTAPSAAASAEPHSTLAEENQLFRGAAEASRGGDVNGALKSLDKLLVEHPASPLAQTALVRKFRLLAKAGRVDEARREAELYLSRYPTGFAVNEAQALKQGAPGGSETAPPEQGTP
jgi:hypothetical protein